MTKTELVAAIAEKVDMPKTKVDEVVGAMTDVITETMAKGDKVALLGFGTFEAVDKPESTALNPRTKETIVVPAHKAPKFKAGKGLKDAINRK